MDRICERKADVVEIIQVDMIGVQTQKTAKPYGESERRENNVLLLTMLYI